MTRIRKLLEERRWAFYLLPFYFLLAPSAHALNVSTPVILMPHVTFETGGAPNGSSVTFNVDSAGGQAELDIFSATTSSQVASVIQPITATGPQTMFWNGFWLINGQYGRIDGNYTMTLTVTDAGSGFIQIPLQPNQPLVFLDSIDIHNVITQPTKAASGDPTFPYLIHYNLAKPAYTTVTIANSTGTIVRTLLNNKLQYDETHSTATLSWDGLNDGGNGVPIGVYTLIINATDPAVPGSAAIPRTATLTVTSLAGPTENPQQLFNQNGYVYPNPVRNGQATFQYETVGPNAVVTLKVYTIDGTEVLSQTFSGDPAGTIHIFPWNVTNQSGRKLGRGLYYYVLKEVDSNGTLQNVQKMAVIQ